MRYTVLLTALAFAGAFAAGCPAEMEINDDEAPNGGEDEAVRQGEAAEMTALEDESGYALSGPWNFEGELLRPVDDETEWRLTGQFRFNTAGYQVGEPETIIQKSLPEQVTVVIPVTPPPSDAMAAQVITETPVETAVEASPEARFNVRVYERAPE
ncbi:MAG: hypothetical protein ACLFV4_10430 [Candidatus Hydrogenedentota bacterium]